MHTIKTKEEFIADIRSIDPSLKRIRLSGVTVIRKERAIKYSFICNETVSAEVQDKIQDEVEKITSPAFKTVEVSIKKIVSDPELINDEIYNFLKHNFPSVSIFMKAEDVRSESFGDSIKYVIRATEDGEEYIIKNRVMNRINEHMATKFCSDFSGVLERKQADELPDLTNEEVYYDEIEKIERRTIKVEDVCIVDDASLGDTAYYIEDIEEGSFTICGKVVSVSERQTKTGKPYLIFNIDDTTGRASGIYFSKKSTFDKVKTLKEGDGIIARVTVGTYAERRSITFEKINFCKFPENFEKKNKLKSSVPKNYKTVFPEKAETVKVATVFDRFSDTPEELKNCEYVVFDLETTGLDVLNCEITEIGAVKVSGGKITEQFTSLIHANQHVPEKITELTGISDEMLKDSPAIGEVIPDFMKFIENCVLVAHNGYEFDFKFIKRVALNNEYEISNKLLDTVDLAKATLPTLKRFDLHTVADYFGIIFRHHRALSDAYATAEALIEMMKIKAKNKESEKE